MSVGRESAAAEAAGLSVITGRAVTTVEIVVEMRRSDQRRNRRAAVRCAGAAGLRAVVSAGSGAGLVGFAGLAGSVGPVAPRESCLHIVPRSG
ncbi:hypothetical protein Ssi02_32700 [Sinosporangium siamense]|uniref:Uncharacterized protein n=1 Tax=Sinosporangium siamense TaxID=1367973 RepID=A0A919RJH6_9ACTN|nr:hypothetical protein Ssi02_32700 [Sinosporangium siamense]